MELIGILFIVFFLNGVLGAWRGASRPKGQTRR